MNTLEWLSRDALTNRYGLPLRSIKLVNQGVNITFKLFAGTGEYYLRLCRHRGRSHEQIEAEIAALLAFRPADEVYVAKPQRLLAGGYVFSCPYDNQIRSACLFAAARGRKAESNAADMRQYGVALAVLHRQMKAFVAKGRPFLPGEIIGDAVRHLAQHGPEFRHLCAKIENIGVAIEANLNRRTALSKGFCHGDAWCGNVHMSGPRTTFFDFDDCCNGPLVVDLVPQIAWLWQSNRTEFPLLVRILLDGYASLAPLCDVDVAAIPPLAQLHEICSIDFLARYCTLEPFMWAECLERSVRMLDDWSPGGAASAYVAPMVGAARMARTLVA